MAFSDEGFEIKSNLDEDGFGLVRFTRGLGRKRIHISKSDQEITSISDRAPSLDLKKPKIETNTYLLESLHQDILVRVLCRVDHEDLLSLKLVSKTMREAVIEAKSSHFDKCTPKKKLPFRDPLVIFDQDSNLRNQDDEIEPPNAPMRRRFSNRQTDLSKISMVLFK